MTSLLIIMALCKLAAGPAGYFAAAVWGRIGVRHG